MDEEEGTEQGVVLDKHDGEEGRPMQEIKAWGDVQADRKALEMALLPIDQAWYPIAKKMGYDVRTAAQFTKVHVRKTGCDADELISYLGGGDDNVPTRDMEARLPRQWTFPDGSYLKLLKGNREHPVHVVTGLHELDEATLIPDWTERDSDGQMVAMEPPKETHYCWQYSREGKIRSGARRYMETKNKLLERELLDKIETVHLEPKFDSGMVADLERLQRTIKSIRHGQLVLQVTRALYAKEHNLTLADVFQLEQKLPCDVVTPADQLKVDGSWLQALRTGVVIKPAGPEAGWKEWDTGAIAPSQMEVVQ